MYNRLFVEICGMFNPLHFIFIGLFFAVLTILLRISRKLDGSQIQKLLFIIACVITVMEIIKILSRIRSGQGPDSWVPLYYCSLFIFAIWLSTSRNPVLQRTGYAYMTMGGIVASVFFVIYPSTSLGMYPFVHPASLHSFVYHLTMCFCGILVLRREVYIPQKKDSLYYFLFVFTACVLAVAVNEAVGTNCMFLRHPFGLAILQPVLEVSKLLYMLIVTAAQAVLLFWVGFGLYTACRFLKRERIPSGVSAS